MKSLYITLSAFLGLMLSFILHAVVETLILRGGVPWSFWHPNYHIPFTIILAVGGIFFGIWIGSIWWRIVYVEKRHHGWFKK